MKLSSRVDYGLSCILRIADFYGERSVNVSEVAKKEGLAKRYAEQLIIVMRRKGLLKSIKGKTGGYLLSRNPGQITVKDVFNAIEGKTLEAVCDRKKGRRSECVYVTDCGIKNSLWNSLEKRMDSYMDSVSLKQLIALRRLEKNWQKK